MRFIKTILISALILMIILSGCNVRGTKENAKKIIDEDDTKKKLELFMEGQSHGQNIFADENLAVKSSDKQIGLGVEKTKLFYYCDSAYYYQVGQYMWRFQLNNDNKIISYIRYNFGE